MISELKITNILKSSGWGLEGSELPWEQSFFYNCRCVACRTIKFKNVNGLSCKLAQIALLINIYLKQNWVECMMSSLVSFAYFTHFPDLSISGNNADVSKQ